MLSCHDITKSWSRINLNPNTKLHVKQNQWPGAKLHPLIHVQPTHGKWMCPVRGALEDACWGGQRKIAACRSGLGSQVSNWENPEPFQQDQTAELWEGEEKKERLHVRFKESDFRMVYRTALLFTRWRESSAMSLFLDPGAAPDQQSSIMHLISLVS